MPAPMVVDTPFRSEERFTQQEFFEWLQRRPAADVNHYELIRGRIVMSPPAGWPHGSLGSRINARLYGVVERYGLGIVQDSSAGYDLPSGDTLEPGVSFISQARFDAGPAPVRGRFLGIVPDLAVEILSKSTARRDRGEKKAIYEQCGVGEYWIVDPDRRVVTVYHLGDAGYGTGERIRAGRIASHVLPQLELTVEDLFAD